MHPKLWDRNEVCKLIYAVFKSLSAVGLAPRFRIESCKQENEYLYLMIEEPLNRDFGLLITDKKLSLVNMPIEELDRKIESARSRLLVQDDVGEVIVNKYLVPLRVVCEILEAAFREGRVLPFYRQKRISEKLSHFIIEVFPDPKSYPDKPKIAAIFKVPSESPLDEVVPEEHFTRHKALLYKKRPDFYRELCKRIGEDICREEQKVLELFLRVEKKKLGKSIDEVFYFL